MKGVEHDKLWNQLEAEIHLHRHKTVIRACRGRNNRRKRLAIPPGHVSNVRTCILPVWDIWGGGGGVNKDSL